MIYLNSTISNLSHKIGNNTKINSELCQLIKDLNNTNKNQNDEIFN